jgi:hypothetical protein
VSQICVRWSQFDDSLATYGGIVNDHVSSPVTELKEDVDQGEASSPLLGRRARMSNPLSACNEYWYCLVKS